MNSIRIKQNLLNSSFKVFIHHQYRSKQGPELWWLHEMSSTYIREVYAGIPFSSGLLNCSCSHLQSPLKVRWISCLPVKLQRNKTKPLMWRIVLCVIPVRIYAFQQLRFECFSRSLS